jgi:hypothetical protein
MNGFGSAVVRWLSKSVLGLVVLVAGPAVVLVGLVLLGEAALERVRAWDRYSIPFADIQCTPPEGLSREDFLLQVRYVSEMPEQIRLLDDGLSERLAQAFARHPRVERVDRVEVLPTREVTVQLTFRAPPH